ncbi:acid protease [Whalleya microplaca]|nr:acid protease [Whalleya microplaca]
MACYLPLPLLLLSYLAIFLSVAAATSPVGVPWSDKVFGPDGPWQAVEVTVGRDQKISLYPGHEFQSFILTNSYCDHNNTPACYATQAGLYNSAKSEIDQTGSTGSIQWRPGPDYMMGMDLVGDAATMWVDNMQVGGQTIASTSIALLDASYLEYPDGRWQPLTVGCLGIGAPKTVNQSFTMNTGPAINASLIPGYLWEQNQIASMSFAMHIGSANHMSGSLYFGGYDQNLIVGDILTESGDYTKMISLRDISINVVDGASPWKFESLGGLLASGNSSINSGGIQVAIDGCSPYLSLPKSTCDAIANNLPVTYNEDFGLYFWNTDNAKYSQIVRSASALEFTFLGNTNTKNITISVPFRHLNLTLTEPLVDHDIQYFPCFTGNPNRYTLGRAFLQDAYVAANWNPSTWWLAQAPGPNIPPSSIIELLENDKEIKASSNDWKESWSGSWTALSADEADGSDAVSPTGTAVPPSTGLSTGARAGIGVGVGIAGLIILGAITFFLRRRKATQSDGAVSSTAHGASNTTYDGNLVPELGNDTPAKNPILPSMTDTSTQNPQPSPDSMMYDQQHPNQQSAQRYSQQYPPQYIPPQQHQEYAHPSTQTYNAELPAIGNTLTELPTTPYSPHAPGGSHI